MTDADPVARLTPGARSLVDAAGSTGTAGTWQWLLTLLEHHGPMAEGLADGVNPVALLPNLRDRIGRGDVGEPLPAQTVVAEAMDRARGRGREQAAERDVAAVILTHAGYTLRPDSTSWPAISTPPASPTPGSPSTYTPRTTRPTPSLDSYGRDLTKGAADGTLLPVVGREEEIALVIETLCRRTKRNPVLVGPAGVGKTAIVEGFAQRVVRGDVPAPLQGVRVVEVQPSTLVAGATYVGDLQERVKGVIADASQEGIILFIDELHSVVGSGGMPGSSDVASLLKPALARGQLACIGATTDEEYRRYIQPDAALERRFQPIRVQEMTREQTLVILCALRDDLARLRGVQVPDPVLDWLLDFAAEFLRNRTFPDKAVDLLEQVVAYAVGRGVTEVSLSDAETVAQRLVGMPVGIDGRLEALHDALDGEHLLRDEDATALLARLSVTMRGFDLRSTRPNVVVLLEGTLAESAVDLSRTVASTLFGSPDRVVTLDLGRMTHPEDVTMLIGAPPGYVGYNDALPLYRLQQMPWSVLLGQRIDLCHPAVREILSAALSDGFLTDARGTRIYLSDAVVILTAAGMTESRHIGFHINEEQPQSEARTEVADALGSEMAAQVDLVFRQVPQRERGRDWLEGTYLRDLAERYRKRGLTVRWDTSIVDWLLGQERPSADRRAWERLIDGRLSPAIIPYLPPPGEQRSVRLAYVNNEITAETEGE